MRFFLLLFLFSAKGLAFGQNDSSNVSIQGHLENASTAEDVMFVCVRVYSQNGINITGGCADYYGDYKIADVPEGVYTLKCFSDEYEEIVVENVTVRKGRAVIINFSLVEKPKVVKQRRPFRERNRN